MDNLELYQKAIKDILLEIYNLGKSSINREGVDSQYVFDTQNNHYILIDVGWEKGVKKEDIILGLHSPFMRQFSDYGVA